PLTLDAPVTSVPGIGAGRAEVLGRLGIEVVRDLLFHFPHRHDDYSRVAPISELRVGEQQTVVANVWSAHEVQIGRSPRKSTELIVGDETGNMQVVFFNNPYPARGLRTNQRVTLSGKTTVYQGMRQMQNPEWEVIDEGSDLDKAIHTGRLVPIYPLTHGLLNRSLRQYIRAAVDACVDQLEDPLPEPVRQAHGYLDLAAAVRQVHYPDDAEALEAARRRLAYEELLLLQLSVLARRVQRASSLRTAPLPLTAGQLAGFVGSLPFPLTGAQEKVIDAILADLTRPTPMARLLQGDVGSGKTVVAATALLAANANGLQSVIMAPTEILAEQHFRTLCTLFSVDSDARGAIVECRPVWWDRPIRIALLRGSLRAKAKRDVQESIALGLVDVAVGTQALIQSSVSFPRLGLTVVDEQHRFGVAQRSALAEKGDNSHLLVMTATPIPRTLALSVYGDLDLSVIDEMPAGRRPVRTRIIESHRRDYAYRFVRDQIELGFQAFVICPLVEESEALEVRAATEEYERLRREVYPDLAISLLHGRMAVAEKDAVMQDFRERRSQILVSTAVVEVGIDIPMATVIMIEGAERFGLAQLHQFRGRVGRAGQQSYCLLLSDSASEESLKRLELLEKTSDGLKLAEYDLEMRGPGDYFGTRQSGLPALRQARMTDLPILEQARSDAAVLLDGDPLLDQPDHAALRRRVEVLAKHAGEAN
ncbi:MAG: ATP-dependent DNA helicase RecG, partial [Dehalococcoidia bacterium]